MQLCLPFSCALLRSRYQMYLDDMPMWAMVGDKGDAHSNDGVCTGEEICIWTHKRLDIGYNGNQIVDVNMTTGKRVKLEEGMTISLTYQVHFTASDAYPAWR